MRFIILIWIQVLISCHYKPVHGGCCSKSQTTEIGKDTLNIKTTKGSDVMVYSELSNSRIFAAQGEHTFSKIVTKNVDIWSSQDNDNATKVLLKGKNDKKKHLAIFLKSRKLVILYRDGKGKPWVDMTSKKHDITNLKFLGENDKAFSTSDYKVDIGFLFSYIVIFNSGVTCKKITLGDKEIWKSTDDKKFEKLTSIVLDLETNDFHVRSHYECKKLDLKLTTTGTGQTGTGTGTTPGNQTGTGTGTTATGGSTTPASGGQTGTGASQPASGTTPGSGATTATPSSTPGTTTPATATTTPAGQAGSTPGSTTTTTGATSTPKSGTSTHTGQTGSPTSGPRTGTAGSQPASRASTAPAGQTGSPTSPPATGATTTPRANSGTATSTTGASSTTTGPRTGTTTSTPASGTTTRSQSGSRPTGSNQTTPKKST